MSTFYFLKRSNANIAARVYSYKTSKYNNNI